MRYVFNVFSGTFDQVVDVDDTPVNGATTDTISSNWAFDHDADVDAHHAQLHAATHKDSGADDLLSAPGAIGSTTPAAATFTDMDVIHTATEADDHAAELDVDAAGYGDVKALDINYCTGALSAGKDAGIVLLNIAQCGATGGDVFGLEVLATDSGSAGIYGMKAGALVGPIHQDSGTFANPTTGTDNTASTDVPAMIDGSTGTTTAIFENDNEYIIIGAAAAFEEMEAILTTTASVSIKPTFWYSTAGTAQFTQFTPVDGTNGFKNTGVVAWDASDLTGHVADDVTGTFDIKITRTKNSLTTSPILGYVKVAATTEYVWDKSGNVNILKLTTSGNIELGHVSDTTLSRASAGVVQIEGKTITTDLAGFTDDGADYNTALGTGALDSVTEGEGRYNTAIGMNAGTGVTTGDHNVFVGYQAGGSCISGLAGVAIGYVAGLLDTEGYATYIGSQAGVNTTGRYNTMIGRNSGYWNTGGQENTIIGYQAASGSLNNTDFDNSVIIGHRAGYVIQTGGNNTFMGYQSGYSCLTGASSVFLGYQSGYYETGSNKLFIDNVARANEADARTKALMYGVFDADPANQTLAINAVTTLGSGSVAVATDAIWDAAGDLVQGTGADAAARLAKGGALALLRMNAGATAAEWGTGGQIVFPATAVPSGDANTLDEYVELLTASTACTGAITTALAYTLVKIGRVVTMSVPQAFGAGVAVNAIGLGVVLPVKYRPAAEVYIRSARMFDNGANKAISGAVQVLSTGSMYIYLDGSAPNFTVTVEAGFYAFCVTWLTAA